MKTNIYLYFLVAALTLYAIRVIPLVLIKREIKNRFIQSFLYYVPYVTLAVMTFPAILTATGSTISAIAGLVVALLTAYFNGNLFKVAIFSCLTVGVVELVQSLIC